MLEKRGKKREARGKDKKCANFTALIRSGYTADSADSDFKALKPHYIFTYVMKLKNFGTKRKQEGREWVEQG